MKRICYFCGSVVGRADGPDDTCTSTVCPRCIDRVDLPPDKLEALKRKAKENEKAQGSNP